MEATTVKFTKIYSDIGDTPPYYCGLGTIPGRAIIHDIYVDITEAFDADTTFEIGIEGGSDYLISSCDATVTGIVEDKKSAGFSNGHLFLSESLLTLRATFNKGGSTLTSGAIDVYVTYFPNEPPYYVLRDIEDFQGVDIETTIATLTPENVLYDIYVDIVEDFDAGTTLTIGTPDSPDCYIASSAIDSSGTDFHCVKGSAFTDHDLMESVDSNTDIIARLNQLGSKGILKIYIVGSDTLFQTYTVSTSTVGSGTVTLTPDTPGTTYYTSGYSLNIEATADANYEFTSWSGDLSGSANPTTITVDSVKSVTATFTQIAGTLTIDEGTGSVTVDGVDYTAPVTKDFDTAIAIVATAAEGEEFSSWSVVSGSATFDNASSASANVTITEDTEIKANFVSAEAELTVNIDPASSSTVTVDGSPYSAPVNIQIGEAIDIVCVPATGYEFVNWTQISGTVSFGDDSSASTTVTISEASTIQANCQLTSHDLDVTVSPSGAGTINLNPPDTDITTTGAETYDYGATVTITVTESNESYEFAGWSGDLSGSETTESIEITEATSITAIFTAIPATIVTKFYNGTTPDSATITNLRFNTADDNDQDDNNKMIAPTAGENYSYWKHVAPYATTKPASGINNVKFYTEGDIDWTGCTVKGAEVTNYDQATGVEGSSGDNAGNSHVDTPTMVDISSNYTSSSPLSLTGSIGNTTGKLITGYLLLQVTLTNNAERSTLDPKTLTWRYDET